MSGREGYDFEANIPLEIHLLVILTIKSPAGNISTHNVLSVTLIRV